MKVNSLRTILIAALAVRLVAVWFAPGFLMHDDHFLTVEPASSWSVGQNFNDWKPGLDNDRTQPEPISFFYPGTLSVVFSSLRAFGIDDPSTQMIWMRLIHALWSLLTIWLAVKTVRLIADEKSALMTGWLLALIGVLPNFAVRNLVEIACHPFLVGGFYLLIRYGSMLPGQLGSLRIHEGAIAYRFSWIALVCAAFILGLCAGVRYQTVLFAAMVGVVILFQGQWLRTVVFGLVSFTAFFLTQIDDVLLWGGKPFQHLIGYFEYNKTHAGNYPGSPFAYLSFIGYFILPPVSLFLMWGFFRTGKKYMLLFLPTAVFMLFHIIYPNRQERFILPALPLFVMLGTIGWNEWLRSSEFWQRRLVLYNNLWRFFWIINSVVLAVMCTTYSKRARVEAMHYLYQRGNCTNFIHEFTHREGSAMLPRHYASTWVRYYPLSSKSDVDYIVSVMPSNAQDFAHRLATQPVPNYILFIDDTNLESRAERMKGYFPGLTYCTTVDPGWFDRVLHRINPLNTLERVHIYEIR